MINRVVCSAENCLQSMHSSWYGRVRHLYKECFAAFGQKVGGRSLIAFSSKQGLGRVANLG